MSPSYRLFGLKVQSMKKEGEMGVWIQKYDFLKCENAQGEPWSEGRSRPFDGI